MINLSVSPGTESLARPDTASALTESALIMAIGDTPQNPAPNASTASGLGLVIPNLAPPPDDTFLLDPRSTSRWLDGLPMANIGETARQVYRAMIDFNHYQIHDVARAKIVELFRSPIAYICDNLQKHYLDVGLPLSDKAWKTALLSRELNLELAASYKIIIERMLRGESERFDRKLLVIAIHRAIYYLQRVWLYSTLVYTTPPAGLWKELHALFAFAQQNRVHQVPIKMKTEQAQHISSIEDLYKQLLLLASASPGRLRQQQMLQLAKHALDWAAMTRFVEVDPEDTPGGRINVLPGTDEGPRHNALRSPFSQGRTLVLDMRNLLQQLRSDIEQAPWDVPVGGQSEKPVLIRPLLRQLIIAWNRPPERAFVRTRLNFELDIVCGLSTLHGQLEGHRSETDIQISSLSSEESPTGPLGSSTLSPYPQSTTSHHSIGDMNNLSLSPVDDVAGNDSLVNDSFLQLSANSLPSDLSGDWSDSLEAPEGADKISLKTLNESAGGYCIDWQSNGDIPKVKVGELIGIASASQRQQFSLGIVRWLRMGTTRKMEVGLQILANQIEAISVRTAGDIHNRRVDSAPSKGLLLAAADQSSTTHQPSLVLNAVSYPVGTELWMKTTAGERLIRLTKLVEFNSAFAQYQFSKSDQPTSESEDNPANNFDDLWNNL